MKDPLRMAAAAAGMVVSMGTASAQDKGNYFRMVRPVPCEVSSEVKKLLSERYGEVEVKGAFGLPDSFYYMANPQTQEFTLLEDQDNGITCVHGNGRGPMPSDLPIEDWRINQVAPNKRQPSI